MLTWLFNRSDSRRKASELYGAVVTFARRPALYADLGIADTPEGRYEALVLHLFLVMERLRAEQQNGLEPSQALLEAFVTDMDDSMREMGVGDLSVPRKVKKAAAAFYDRAEVYRAAMAAPDNSALADALGRLVPAEEGRDLDAMGLAADLRRGAGALAVLPLEDLLAGRLPESGSAAPASGQLQ
jgi:cytochrome b pre-mRNA-processing protein 3